jgi:hypothetical protein
MTSKSKPRMPGPAPGPEEQGRLPTGSEDGDGSNTPGADDDDVRAFLGFLSWHADDTRGVSEAQTDYLLRQIQQEDVDPDAIQRIGDEVVRRRLIDQADKIGQVLQSAEAGRPGRREITDPAVPTGTQPSAVPRARPSFIRRCKDAGQDLHTVSRALHLDPQILFTLEQGHATGIPQPLILEAASIARLSPAEVTICFAPGPASRLAAHGSPESGRAAHTILRFLDLIEGSRLGEADKQYWRDVVASETVRMAPSE